MSDPCEDDPLGVWRGAKITAAELHTASPLRCRMCKDVIPVPGWVGHIAYEAMGAHGPGYSWFHVECARAGAPEDWPDGWEVAPWPT